MKGTWRQEQARQNFQDHIAHERRPGEAEIQALDAAIEIATTVKITQDALDAMTGTDPAYPAAALGKALEVLGFEVIA